MCVWGRGGVGAGEMGETTRGGGKGRNNKDRWEKATEGIAGAGKTNKGRNSGDG